jgi:hypothetical protein
MENKTEGNYKEHQEKTFHVKTVGNLEIYTAQKNKGNEKD